MSYLQQGRRDRTAPEIRQEQKREAAQEADDLAWVLSTVQGRRFIARIISSAGVFDQSFQGNSRDAFAAGRRDFGLGLFNQIADMFPESFRNVIDELYRRNSNG